MPWLSMQVLIDILLDEYHVVLKVVRPTNVTRDPRRLACQREFLGMDVFFDEWRRVVLYYTVRPVISLLILAVVGMIIFL